MSLEVDALAQLALCDGLSRQEVGLMAATAQPLSVPAGEMICRQGDSDDSMFLILDGRVRVEVLSPTGKPRVLNYLSVGEHFGEMSMLLGSPRTASVVAVLPTELLELDRAGFEKLLSEVPHFAANLSRSLGVRLRAANYGQRARNRPEVIGVCSTGGNSNLLFAPLADQFAARIGTPIVLSNRHGDWPHPSIPRSALPADDSSQLRSGSWRADLRKLLVDHNTVLIDRALEPGTVPRAETLAPCDELLWLVDPRMAEQARSQLRDLLLQVPELSRRTRVVWVCRAGDPRPPVLDGSWPLETTDIRVTLDDPITSTPSLSQRRDLTRLVRSLARIKIGLALGGGGARGLAHIGALAALDEAGIFFDQVAGTSIGSLVGLFHGYGYTFEQMLDMAAEELVPPRWVQALPGGKKWFMISMFRFGGWERKLRRILGDCQLEQLPTPLEMISVDLVTGNQVVRATGDVVSAVLDSINLPGISKPRLRDGQALVDGGVLNNIPGDVLREQGADVVIGIDVASKLEQSFAGSNSTARRGAMRTGGWMETLLRVLEVQQKGLVSPRTSAFDLMITPDVALFDFADFSAAAELAAVGRSAAAEALPRIKQLVASVERPTSEVRRTVPTPVRITTGQVREAG